MGVECVAACDLYDSRHLAAQECVGKQVPVTREYRELLERKDIDALIVATSDHWHRRLVEEGTAAGKDVYCEKPMSHTLEDGFAMVQAVAQNHRILQVGSQRVSSIVYAKAREIFHSGKLGQVTAIEATWDRNTPGGAWVNPIPPDANERTIDWERFLGNAPKRAFDPKRFFRWRCFARLRGRLGGRPVCSHAFRDPLHHRHAARRRNGLTPPGASSAGRRTAISPTCCGRSSIIPTSGSVCAATRTMRAANSWVFMAPRGR